MLTFSYSLSWIIFSVARMQWYLCFTGSVFPHGVKEGKIRKRSDFLSSTLLPWGYFNQKWQEMVTWKTFWVFKHDDAFFHSCGRHKKNENKRLNMLGGFLNFPHHRFLSKKVSERAHLKHICYIWVHLHWIMQTKSLKPPRSNNNWLNNFFAA